MQQLGIIHIYVLDLFFEVSKFTLCNNFQLAILIRALIYKEQNGKSLSSLVNFEQKVAILTIEPAVNRRRHVSRSQISSHSCFCLVSMRTPVQFLLFSVVMFGQTNFRKFVKAAIVGEVVLCLGAYRVWHQMNTSRGTGNACNIWKALVNTQNSEKLWHSSLHGRPQ